MAPRSALAVGFLAVSLLVVPFRAAAMDIIPAFDSSITNAPNAQEIESSINTSTAAVGSLFTNPGTVKILFEYEAPTNANFLGESFNHTIPVSYSSYTALLESNSQAHPENTVLATAIANLSSGNDANGNKPVSAATALLRVGLGDASATPCFDAQGNFVAGCNSIYDGVIVLNSSADLAFTRPVPAFTGGNVEYDAIETEEHEIDEVLGGGGWGTTLGSFLPGFSQGTDFGVTDLYRYSAPGTKSYQRSSSATSYFSIDGGETPIVGFSQLNDGSDYGDWGPDISACPDAGFFGGPGYVQDTDSCSNKQSDVTNASPEFIMLEALGYDPSAAALKPVIAWNCSASPDTSNYSGSINAIKEGSCTQIVTGDSTFTGGTNIDTGVLQLGNGGATGSVSGDIVDSGVLVFDHSNTITYGGTISGGGALKQSGTGLLILTGDNTFTGLTTIALGAALQLGNGGTSGSLGGDVADHGSLIFDRSDTLVFGGAITGQGSVTLTGAGTVIFTGDNTYVGGTTIASGTLQIGNGGTSGVFQGAVMDNGTLAFDRSDTVIFKAQISGTGALAQIGAGTTILTAANSYTGGTFIGSGTFQVGNAKTTGTIVGDVLDNGVLAFDRTDAISFAGTISGNGAVQQLGPGTLTLTGTNSYGGGTLVGAGTLEPANSSALGTGTLSLDGAPATLLLDNGVNLANPVSIAQASFIDVNGTDSAALSGLLSGSAPFEKDGTGTLAITGNNATYSGDISFHGTLSIGATGALGSGIVTVLGSTILLGNGVTYTNPTVLADDVTVEQDGGAATITGPISSNGLGNWGLAKTGAGTLTLANINSYAGPTEVANGLLVVAGALPGSVTVDAGASVAITGVVGGNVTVLAGGSMAPAALGPGYASGTLASYSETNSTLSIRFGGSSAAFANDAVIVPGTVTLNGGTLDPHPSTPASDFPFDQRYVVIDTPNTIAGSFANPAGFVVNAYDPALFQRVRYDLGGVVLEIRRPIDFNAVSNTPNAHAAAGAINSSEMAAGDAWTSVINALSALSPADQADALHRISGEGLVDASHVAGDNLEIFDKSLRAHLVDNGADIDGQSAPLGNGGRLWVATLGRDEQTPSQAGYSGYSSQAAQFAFGADTMLTGSLTLGAAASIGHPTLDVPSLATSTGGQVNAFGAYGRYDFDAVSVNAVVTGDFARLHAHRAVAFGTVTDDLSAVFHQHATMASVEVDGRVDGALGNDLEPFVRASYLANAQDGFRERDAGAGLGLVVAPLSHALWAGTMGGRWSHTYFADTFCFAPDVTAAIALNSPVNAPETTAALQGAPANTGTFVVTALHDAPVAALIGAGISAGLAGSPAVLHLDYEGDFSARARSNNGVLNVTYSW